MNDRITEIEKRINNLPPTPWFYSEGDDFDHWQLWGNDSTSMIQDDAGCLPDRDFVDFLENAKSDIEYLLQLIKEKRDEWKCECDWEGWFLCWERKDVPDNVPVKEIPEENGKYLVRVFDDGDDSETESEFSTVPKNWGQDTNYAISHWEITYCDNWTGYRGVYAWKKNDHS